MSWKEENFRVKKVIEVKRAKIAIEKALRAKIKAESVAVEKRKDLLGEFKTMIQIVVFNCFFFPSSF